MNKFLRNIISKLYNAVSAYVASRRDALAERLWSLHETASLLYNRMIENMEYGRQRLKDIIEKEPEEEAKEQQQEEVAKEQDDDGQCDTIAKITLVYERKRVK